MNTNWYMDQGYTHKICEDYATIGDGFVIVSDGCSSSEHTDIGARLLCMASREVISRVLKSTGKKLDSKRFYYSLRDYVMGMSVSSASNIGLPATCLDATLMIAFIFGDYVYVFVYGDGYVAVKYNNGLQKYYKFEFPENMPYYPSYSLDLDRDNVYRDKIKIVKCGTYLDCKDGGWIKLARRFDDADAMMLQFKVDDISNVLIMSDGVDSFTMPDIDILKEITNFKMLQGEFVRRRLNAMMKQFTKKDIRHYDDLTVGGLNL